MTAIFSHLLSGVSLLRVSFFFIATVKELRYIILPAEGHGLCLCVCETGLCRLPFCFSGLSDNCGLLQNWLVCSLWISKRDGPEEQMGGLYSCSCSLLPLERVWKVHGDCGRRTVGRLWTIMNILPLKSRWVLCHLFSLGKDWSTIGSKEEQLLSQMPVMGTLLRRAFCCRWLPT